MLYVITATSKGFYPDDWCEWREADTPEQAAAYFSGVLGLTMCHGAAPPDYLECLTNSGYDMHDETECSCECHAHREAALDRLLASIEDD